MGRPPKTLRDKRSERVLVRLTPSEKKLLIKAAKKFKMPVAVFVQRAVGHAVHVVLSKVSG